MTNKFGMTDAEFEKAVERMRAYVNHHMNKGGYPEIEKCYLHYKGLVEDEEADNEDRYRLMVLTNILVMA